MKKGLIAIASYALGATTGVAVVNKKNREKLDQKKRKVDKFKGYYNLLIKWLELKQQGVSLEKFFVDAGIQSIAIYGLGELGARLYDELAGSTITVQYGIDKKSIESRIDIPVKTMEDTLPQVDAIVVTAFFDYDAIEEALYEKTDSRIISLEEVVFGLA